MPESCSARRLLEAGRSGHPQQPGGAGTRTQSVPSCRSPSLPSKIARRVRGAAQGRSAPLPREPKRCQVPPGHRSPPPWGSPRPSPLPAPSRRALLGSSLCPAPVELPWPVLSRCGARRAPEAGPLLPPGQPGSVSASLRSDRSFTKFLPTRSPRPPSREPAGAAVHPAALPAPRPLPPPLSGFPSPVSGTGAELLMLSRP